MLRFNKKVEYALIALVNMEPGMEQISPVTSKSLSVKFNIPPEVMGKVLQALARNGILSSVQGMRGGYVLSRPIDDINVLEVIEAIDGAVALASCVYSPQADCDQYGYCGIQTPVQMIQNELISFFKKITMQDVKEKCTSANPHIQIQV